MSSEPHTPVDIFRSALNASGHPFHYAVLDRLRVLNEKQDSPWVLQVNEFPVEVGASATRIDFLLAQWSQSMSAYRRYLVAECKRANPKLGRWLFARAPYTQRDPDDRTVLIETLFRSCQALEEGDAIAGCARVSAESSVYHVALEARADRPGDAHGGSRGAIEDAAAQVIRGTNGLARTLARHRTHLPRNDAVRFVPVIFTTAEIWTIKANLASADLASGMIELAANDVERKAWLWYQYHQSPGLRHDVRTYFQPSGRPETSEGLGPLLDNEFARAIAVVSPDGIDDFIKSGLARL